MTNKPATIRKLEAIYASLPTIDCKRLCGRTNCGPVAGSHVEARYIKESGFEFRRAPFERINELTCTYLNPEGQCDIYSARPLICRLFGLVDVREMRCPHGCVPSKWITQQEASEIMRQVHDL